MPFVVIRLRSNPTPLEEPCIHLSNPATNTLTVYNSKTQQDFTFDMIATDTATQGSIFNTVVGSIMETIQKGLASSQYRMDHLMMGYGQSGAGKSYTMFGERRDEGILPRLMDKMNEEGYELGLRAFEIYNEQFYDLLAKYHRPSRRESFPRQSEKQIEIKQDLERGVHIQGLELISVPKTSQSIDLVSDILSYNYSSQTIHNDRKSHKVLTLFIKHVKYHTHKEIKLHFVELASCDGQREYFTRRPSISINKSLSNLNTILSNLMDISNGKPKKHIPFRESKLTFYLKDMLSAPGSNKWVFTNLFVERNKLSESINSLMFAKRAKCLAEGGNVKENNDMDGEKTARRNIRQEVKMMRKQLENSRFIHGKSIDTEWDYAEDDSLEKSLIRSPLKMVNLSPCKSPGVQKGRNREIQMNVLDPHPVPTLPLQILVQNQTNFRDILKLYEQRIIYFQSKQNKNEGMKGVYNQKRLLQNLNHKYAKLVLNFPVFANIISENKDLKEDLLNTKQQLQLRNNEILQLLQNRPLGDQSEIKESKADIRLANERILRQQQVLGEYQSMIERLQRDIRRCGEELIAAHEADLSKERQEQVSDKVLRVIKNQNDCLKLTILTQEEEIERLHQEYSFISLEIKAISEENRALMDQNKYLKEIVSKGSMEEHGLQILIQQLVEIKASAEKDGEEIERLISINKQLTSRIEQLSSNNSHSAKNKPSEGRSASVNQSTKTAKLQTQAKSLRKLIKEHQDKKLLLQKQLSKLSCKVAELNRELSLSKQTEVSLFQELSNSNEKVKLLEIKEKVQGEKFKQFSLDMAKVKKELQIYSERSKLVKQEFNRSQIEIVEDYREMISSKRLSLARKGRSELENLFTCRSTKGFQGTKSLNTTVIVSSQKLATIVEPPRLSSGQKVVSKESREFKREKQKEKQKEIKPFLFKSKEIKNSIVQKP